MEFLTPGPTQPSGILTTTFASPSHAKRNTVDTSSPRILRRQSMQGTTSGLQPMRSANLFKAAMLKVLWKSPAPQCDNVRWCLLTIDSLVLGCNHTRGADDSLFRTNMPYHSPYDIYFFTVGFRPPVSRIRSL